MEKSLEFILKKIKRKKWNFVYTGELPRGILGIKRISTVGYDYSEIIFEKLDESAILQIAEKLDLKHEKKRRTEDLRCEDCPVKKECVVVDSDRESSSAYTIIKPRKFWFPNVIMDLVYNSARIYDTKKGVEMGSRIIKEYLNL